MAFIVYTAGRSRTAWLADFLTYGHCQCHFEMAARLSSFADVKQFFSVSGNGTAETAAARGWRLLHHHFPAMRIVVVRRPAEEIIASFARSVPIDQAIARRNIAYSIRCLADISRLPLALTVDFHDLDNENTCKAVFEHCLPHAFDHAWWKAMRDKNIQIDVVEFLKHHLIDNRERVEGFARSCRRELISLAGQGLLRK